jgi:hypothetical protein
MDDGNYIILVVRNRSLVTGRQSLVVGRRSLNLLIITILFDIAREAVLYDGEAIA